MQCIKLTEGRKVNQPKEGCFLKCCEISRIATFFFFFFKSPTMGPIKKSNKISISALCSCSRSSRLYSLILICHSHLQTVHHTIAGISSQQTERLKVQAGRNAGEKTMYRLEIMLVTFKRSDTLPPLMSERFLFLSPHVPQALFPISSSLSDST